MFGENIPKNWEFLNFDFRTKCVDLFVEIFEKNPELEKEFLKLPKMRFAKKNFKIWIAIVF